MRSFIEIVRFIHVLFSYCSLLDIWVWISHQVWSICLMYVMIKFTIVEYLYTYCDIVHWGSPICSFTVSIMFTLGMWILIVHWGSPTCSLDVFKKYTSGRIFVHNLSWACSLRLPNFFNYCFNIVHSRMCESKLLTEPRPFIRWTYW